MIDLMYCYKGDWEGFGLFEIKNGKREFIDNFEDREDLLIYIEKNYDFANLKIVKGDK